MTMIPDRRVKLVTCLECGSDLIPSDCHKHHVFSHRRSNSIKYRIKEYYE